MVFSPAAAMASDTTGRQRILVGGRTAVMVATGWGAAVTALCVAWLPIAVRVAVRGLAALGMLAAAVQCSRDSGRQRGGRESPTGAVDSLFGLDPRAVQRVPTRIFAPARPLGPERVGFQEAVDPTPNMPDDQRTCRHRRVPPCP